MLQNCVDKIIEGKKHLLEEILFPSKKPTEGELYERTEELIKTIASSNYGQIPETGNRVDIVEASPEIALSWASIDEREGGIRYKKLTETGKEIATRYREEQYC